MDSAGEVRLICGWSWALRAWQRAAWRMKTNTGPCNSQWSSLVTLRDRERTGQERVFIQVCVVAGQLLWNNFWNQTKSLAVCTNLCKKRVSFTKMEWFIILRENPGWALPQKHTSLTNPCTAFPCCHLSYLGKEMLWYVTYKMNYSEFAPTAWNLRQAAFKVFTGVT